MKAWILAGILWWGACSFVLAKEWTIGFFLGSGGLGDQSFNDMTYVGLGKAQKEYDVKLIIEDPGNSVEIVKTAFERLLEKKTDLLITNGWEFVDLLKEYAKRYPQQKFLINDVPLEGLPNVASTVYAQHEGAFLAGALAGWMTHTQKVGFIGGVDLPVIHAFRVGYREGVQYANPQAQVFDVFVSHGQDFSGFSNPAQGHQLALAQYQQGADIIFAVAGLTGNGIIRAAQQQKKFAIGVDADQDHMAQGYILTSMMKRLDEATFREVTKLIQGKFQPGIQYYSLKEGGVSLTSMKYTQHLIPEEIKKKLKETEQQIIQGQIKVTDALK